MCLAETVLKSEETLNLFEFKYVALSHKPIIQSYGEAFKPESCEYSFANLYCWQEPYNYAWSIYKERLVIYDGVNKCSFFPLGKALTPEELVVFSREMEKKGMGTDIGLISLDYLETYPETAQSFTIIEERDHAEYIYSVDALSELKGSKLHKKKNLISQFHRKYTNATAQPLTKSLIKKAVTLADEIYNGYERFLQGIEDEHIALMKALDGFSSIGLEGLALSVGDDLVAFSIFSPLNHNTYDIHFEKACYKFKGAAQVINHETAKYLMGKCQYLNREQDLGIQGLRQAKMSYEPERLLKVHTLVLNPSG